MNCTGKPTCGCRPCTRQRDIITLLRSLRDAGETLQRGDGGGKIKFESRALSMPAAYNAGSYEALLEALGILRNMSRQQEGARGAYWNVAERYLRSERLTRGFVNVGGSYFEAVKLEERVEGAGFVVTYRAGSPKPRNVEILNGVAQPRVPIVRRPGVRSVFVRAVIERWDAGVEARPLATGLDVLGYLMPASIRLPSEVRAAA
jgi:hypothetical protein